MYHVYFLQSKRNSRIYCGFTDRDPKVRLKEHNEGSNKWTRQNGPFLLLYFESYCCEEDARKREMFYKSGFGRKIRGAILSIVK